MSGLTLAILFLGTAGRQAAQCRSAPFAETPGATAVAGGRHFALEVVQATQAGSRGAAFAANNRYMARAGPLRASMLRKEDLAMKNHSAPLGCIISPAQSRSNEKIFLPRRTVGGQRFGPLSVFLGPRSGSGRK